MIGVEVDGHAGVGQLARLAVYLRLELPRRRIAQGRAILVRSRAEPKSLRVHQGRGQPVLERGDCEPHQDGNRHDNDGQKEGSTGHGRIVRAPA